MPPSAAEAGLAAGHAHATEAGPANLTLVESAGARRLAMARLRSRDAIRLHRIGLAEGLQRQAAGEASKHERGVILSPAQDTASLHDPIPEVRRH